MKYTTDSIIRDSVPASESRCSARMPQRCCTPKSRSCEHQRRNSAASDCIVLMYPTPMSVMCTHLLTHIYYKLTVI